ncbi:MAG: hypothetical protein NTV82_03065 [Candidatus Aminicenantes bacterium]|nr:hypothetical protein [Candidatus Aminicenantes bacterium]
MNKKRDRKGISPKGGAQLQVPGPGRPKGTPNKLSRTAKENIEKVYGMLGDLKGHVAFLKKHPRELAKFYSDVYPKLLAINVQHSGPNGGPMVMIMPRPPGMEEKK